MSWACLLLAIVLEVLGTTCMKLSQGFTKTVPSVLMVILYGLCFSSLTVAVKRIEISVAYAVWSGLGTALIATIGIVWFKEPVTGSKLVSLGAIVIGVLGLNLTGRNH